MYGAHEGETRRNVAYSSFLMARADAEIIGNAVFLLYHFARPTPLGKRHSSPFG
jgi:hypothetical protein